MKQNLTMKKYIKQIEKGYKVQKRAKSISKLKTNRFKLEKDVGAYKEIYGNLIEKNLINENDIREWLKCVQNDPHGNEAFVNHPSVIAERNEILNKTQKQGISVLKIQ